MDYILDYLNNLLETKQTNLVFSSFQNIQTQDPLSKLIKCLNTEKRAAIKIKSEEDILIDDFLYTNNSSIIQLNLDHQENVHKNKDKDNVLGDIDDVFRPSANFKLHYNPFEEDPESGKFHTPGHHRHNKSPSSSKIKSPIRC
jgi:hypothetical protein